MKEIGGLSRKAKINVFIAIFIIFIIISIFTSINQISNIIKNREKIAELQSKLEYERLNNIKLLAEEKALYDLESIEKEARVQFNMVKDEEINFFIDIEQDNKDSTSSFASPGTSSVSGKSPEQTGELAYSDSNLWENIKIFYSNEMQ